MIALDLEKMLATVMCEMRNHGLVVNNTSATMIIAGGILRAIAAESARVERNLQAAFEAAPSSVLEYVMLVAGAEMARRERGGIPS